MNLYITCVNFYYYMTAFFAVLRQTKVFGKVVHRITEFRVYIANTLLLLLLLTFSQVDVRVHALVIK